MAEGAVPLAIVGIGCIFPRAHGTVRYWSHIKNGVDAVGPVPATHWQPEDYFDGDPKAPDMTYAKRGAFLESVDFSPQEFGISPNDIEAIDTSQLLGLLAARKALDDAGYNAEREFDRSKVSVILGVTGTLELVIPLGARLGHPKWRKSLQESGVDESTAQDVIDRIADSYVPWQENSFPGLLGNVVAGRIANRLNLHGTNCVVDAACASSLSAIHMAAMELSLGKSDVAVTGGIDTFNDIFMYMCFSKTPALSKTGDAKPFDENGDGTILGEGLGVVVLKRLADAERDGDRVYAVIKGIGTSSDGKGNAVYAPTSEGQMRCLQDAYRTANVSPASIELIEAHGTGTRVGDSVEATALTEVFRNATDRLGFCALGSVKSMIGHTKAAAGVAGLIKVALALYHKVLPPTIKVTRPVSVLNQESPFYLNTQARPWITQGGQPRFAGMSAFGFGGSNFHAVLTEHQAAKQAPDWDGQIQILPFSANSRGELLTQLDQLAEQDYQRICLRAKELRTRFRSDLPHRLVVILSIDSNLVQIVAKTKQLLANQSDTTKLWLIKEGIFYSNSSPLGKLGVLFPGQGSQYPAMLRDLACTFPCWIEELSRLEAEWNNPDRMVDAIYPRQNWSREDRDIQVEKLKGTLFAQPSLGVMSWSSWRTLTDFGVQSDQFLGHSYGEVVALCAAGRLAKENLYHVSLARANAMAKATAEIQGAMCAVHSSVEVVEENVAEFAPQVVIANYNSPNQVVVSGTVAGIAQLETKLQRQKIRFSRLPVATAFHSALVAPAAEVFRRNLEEIAITPGSATVYANETAMPYPQDGGEAIELLARQLAKPVRFAACIERMYEAGVRTFLEVGPNSVLSKLTTQILANRPDCQVVALDGSQGKNPPLWDLASCLSQLAALGYSVDLTKWQESYQPEVTTQQGFTVKICGANYTKPRPKRPPVARKEVAKTKPLVVEKVIMNNPSSSPLPHQTAGPAPAVVAESTLQLFQKMQEDTARLHKQFLDHQQAVLATFQALVSGVPPAINVQPIQHSNAPVQVRSEISAPAAISPPPPRPVTEPIATPTPAPKLVPPPEPVKAAPSSSVIGDIQTILLSVVAEKTGYPTEMLDLDMHLDADLGIDSIKRVEILSAFQERVPDAPPVQPDQLGTLQTLRDVMNVLQTAVLPVNQGIDPTSTSSKQAPKAVVSTTNMQQVLLSVVAEKTGYPTEMLDLSMHLDADLGIDSIKRVEILSAFQERVPDAPAVQPEQLGALQTLQDVMSVLQANEMAPEQNTNGVHISPTLTIFEDYAQILLDVVADKTGYPVEMLQWEMHLDADLGIDSIKRVEILSAFQERVPTSKAVEPEQLGSLQTLQDVANVLKGQQIADSAQPHELNGGPPLPFVKPLADQSIGERENKHADQFGNSPVNLNQLVAGLQVLEPTCQPFDPGLERGRVSLPRGATVVVVCNEESIAQSISQVLAEQGFQTICLDWQQLDSLVPNDSIAGLVLVAPSQSVPQINLLGFQWLQRFAGCLKGSAKQSGAFFACITTLGGQFGFEQLSNADVEQGGLLGIVKTAAHEFSNVNCKAIDVDPTALQSNIRQIIEELFCVGPIELGITEDGLVHVVETPLVLPASMPPAKLPHGATIIVTGGGRGVTTEAIFPLACAVRPRLILLGRTELDSTEPAWLQELTDDASIKKALIQHSPTRPTPREIEKQCTRILNQRTIRQNIARLAEVCTSVEYIAIDVCNRADIQKVVRQIQHQHGEVAGIVHGAGILHDRKIEDLTTEQFQAVYTTKVDGLQALLGAIDPTKLRLLILFSSSTARYGRTGQIAYAASNEVLNKISQRMAQTTSLCRTVAVNWGPWAGGMVNEGLAKLFASEGIGLISYSQGGAVLLAASSLPDFPAELVVIAEPNDAKDKLQKRTLTLDWQRSPILQSHVLNDVAVVPLAMQLNWLMQQNLQFSAAPVLIENFQVLKPIQVSPAHETVVELEMQPAALQHGAIRSYSATLFYGKQLFSRAQLHVGIAQPAESVSRYKPDRPAPSIDEVYSGILFHGKGLQVITEIGSLSEFGAEAIATNPFHETTFAVNDNNRIFAIDAALQLVIIWTAKYLGAPSLPYSIGKFRHLTTSSDVQSWHVRLEITHRSATSVRSNIDILDPEGMLLMQLYQVEHVLNANLQEIFQLSRQRPAPGYSTLVN